MIPLVQQYLNRGGEYQMTGEMNKKRVKIICLLTVFFLRALLLPSSHANAEAAALHILPTIDNDAYRLTIRIVDFPSNTPENAFLLNSTYFSTKTIPNLLSGYLCEDGYPINKEGVSMASLFSGSTLVNHLFPENADGIWLFDSTQCFATLRDDVFTLYHELGTTDEENATTLAHGQFLPFNDLTPGIFSVP